MISKGFAALNRSKIASDSAENASILQDLHPTSTPEQEFSVDDKTFISPININFFPDDVRSYISRLGNLIAPGSDKYRFEHLRQLIGGTNSEAGNRFCIALTPFLLRIARGTIPPDIISFLASANLIALHKEEGKLRPIALGDALRKIAIGVGTEQSKNEIVSQMGNIQLGMSKSGCELIYHTFNVSSELHPTHDAMFIDGINAFNRMNRKEALAELKAILPQFVGYFLAFYGSSSSLWFGLKHIKAEVGVQQGDVFAPLIYALSTLKLLRQANNLANNTSNGLAKGFFDDISTHASTTNSLQILELYITEGPKYGFYVNPKKTVILLGPESSPDIAVSKKDKYCSLLNIPSDSPNVIIHPDNDPSTLNSYGTRLLGCPVGSVDFHREWLIKQYNTLVDDCQLVVDIPDAQLQWCFFHYILSRKINHILRCVNPRLLFDYISQVDQLLKNTFEHIIKATITDKIWTQVKTSIGIGGLGVPDFSTHCYSAHAASCLEVLPHLNSIFSSDVISNLQWFHNMLHCVTTMHELVTTSENPDIDSTILQLNSLTSLVNPRKLQKKFSNILSKSQDSSYLKTIRLDDDFNWSRIHSLCNPESGAILTATLNRDNTCSSEEFQVILRDRLGMKHPFISDTTYCTCAKGCLIGEHGEHAHACAKGGERDARHKSVLDHCCDMITLSGVAVTQEPNDCFALEDSKKRPDFIAKNLNRPGKSPNTLGDVSIVFPGGKSYIKLGSANRPGVAADHQSEQKSKMYSPLAASSNHDFIGLIFESYGMFHKEVKDLINLCCSRMASRRGKPFAMLKKYWTTRISVAVVRGTARMILTKYFDVVTESGVRNTGCLDVLDHSHSVFASPLSLGSDVPNDGSVSRCFA